MRQISEKRPLKPVMTPSLSRTRIPSAVESSVAVRRERASLNWFSAATCAVASWAEITKPSTVGSSMRSTMLSSNGTDDFPSWRSSPTLMVTGWAAVAPRAASRRAVTTWRRSASATMSVSGRISMSSGSWPNSRVIAPEADSRSPVADTSMITEPTLCTRDLKRASWPLASSKRRRLVRSRRQRRTRFLPDSLSGVPTISTRRHPVTDSTRISMGSPTSLS